MIIKNFIMTSWAYFPTVRATKTYSQQLAMEITLRDGSIGNFCHDRWLQGVAPKDLAPSLFAFSVQKNISVRDTLREEIWLLDLRHGLRPEMLCYSLFPNSSMMCSLMKTSLIPLDGD